MRIKKNNEDVFVDLDTRENDVNGNPIKQGSTFKNTGVVIEDEQMKKVDSHSIRNTLKINMDLQQKKSKTNK